MRPGRYDFTVYRGGTLGIGLSARDASDVAISFDKYTTMRMQVRHAWDKAAGEPLLELTSANGGLTVVNAGLGISVNMHASETASLAFDEGVYDLELVIEAEGEEDIVDKMLYGKFYVMSEVTV